VTAARDDKARGKLPSATGLSLFPDPALALAEGALRGGPDVGAENANYVETFLVTGTNGENSISASAAGQAEAWYRAAKQARSLGMLGRASPS
jgi:hypothetical protein